MKVYWHLPDATDKPFETEIDDELLAGLTLAAAMQHVIFCVTIDFMELKWELVDEEEVASQIIKLRKERDRDRKIPLQ